MVIEGIVLAVQTSVDKNGVERKAVDLEGIQLAIRDPKVVAPPGRKEIRATVYVNWIRSSKGNFCSYELQDWSLL
ncbi:hypothetical protein CCP3SC15_1720005 [Gammaproteobacteria bacterium]